MYSLAGFVSGNFKNSVKVSVLDGVCTIWVYPHQPDQKLVSSLLGNAMRLTALPQSVD
jgi:hypothetical protein